MTDPRPERSLIASFIVGRYELGRLLENRIDATGLTTLDAVVIRALMLNRNPTVGHIRSSLALPASTATAVVDRLVEKGFARRDADYLDRRLAVVHLAGPGGQVARMVDAAVVELEQEIVSEAHVSRVEVARVVDGIELVATRDRRMRLRNG